MPVPRNHVARVERSETRVSRAIAAATRVSLALNPGYAAMRVPSYSAPGHPHAPRTAVLAPAI